MKRILPWLVPCLLAYFELNAQMPTQGFIILNVGFVPNISDFIQALKTNDLDKYRHADHRTVIHFSEGLDVQLLSGKEMLEAGLPVAMSKVNTTAQDRTRNLQFSLHSSGRIIISATPIIK